MIISSCLAHRPSRSCISVTHTIVADDCLPQAVFLFNLGVKVPWHNELVMGGHCLDDVIKLDVKGSFVFIIRCERRGAHSDQSEVSVPHNWCSDSHQALTDGSWSEVELLYELVTNGKAYATYAWFLRGLIILCKPVL